MILWDIFSIGGKGDSIDVARCLWHSYCLIQYPWSRRVSGLFDREMSRSMEIANHFATPAQKKPRPSDDSAREFGPVRILVEQQYVRAAKGGLGEAKTSANYAASLLAAKKAKEKGYDQVLWLDAGRLGQVEEVGTMNIFFVIGEELVTPPLSGSILPGITRDSVLRIARDWGWKVSERSVNMGEVTKTFHDGSLREIFGTGTAAVISPVGTLSYNGKEFNINGGRVGEMSRKLFDEITGIQYGEIPDRYGWV